MKETNNRQGFIVKVDGGYFRVVPSSDAEYPGVDVEFVGDTEDFNKPNASRPKLLFEKPKNSELRLLVWKDKDSEDYSKEILFD